METVIEEPASLSRSSVKFSSRPRWSWLVSGLRIIVKSRNWCGSTNQIQDFGYIDLTIPDFQSPPSEVSNCRSDTTSRLYFSSSFWLLVQFYSVDDLRFWMVKYLWLQTSRYHYWLPCHCLGIFIGDCTETPFWERVMFKKLNLQTKFSKLNNIKVDD